MGCTWARTDPTWFVGEVDYKVDLELEGKCECTVQVTSTITIGANVLVDTPQTPPNLSPSLSSPIETFLSLFSHYKRMSREES
jgi:hypothetical protein